MRLVDEVLLLEGFFLTRLKPRRTRPSYHDKAYWLELYYPRARSVKPLNLRHLTGSLVQAGISFYGVE